MKKLICLFLCVLLSAAAAISESENRYIFDMTGVFTETERAVLESDASAAARQTGYEPYFLYLPVQDGETSIKQRTLDFCEEHALSGKSIIFAQTDELMYVYAGESFASVMPADFLDMVLALDGSTSSVYEAAGRYIGMCRSMLLTLAEAPAAQNRRLVDEADLLTDAEEAALLARMDAMAENGPLDIAAVIPKSLNGKTPTEYADDFYDYNDYGKGANEDGVLFLFCMEDRDMAISTCGYGIEVFTDYGISEALNDIRPHLSAGDYAGAVSVFLDRTEWYTEDAGNGTPFDVTGVTAASFFSAGNCVIIGFIGLIIGFFITLKRARSSIKSIRRKPAAANYLKKTPDYTVFEDIFINKTLIKTRISESSSSGGHGGSSTHTSSSGTSHGGGSGKF